LAKITANRVERIAKSHPCGRCGEYSYIRVKVKSVVPDPDAAQPVAWQASLRCGVCGADQELGISDDGDILYSD
jgi:hypothetical protein